MPSSTSSFSRSVPTPPWITLLGRVLILCLSVAAALEFSLMELGYLPTIQDTQSDWERQRTRVQRLGDRALILVGASRFQLGLDLEVLRNETGLEPVQLAIDGSSFVPVLAGLASDVNVRGHVLVDYYDADVASLRSSGVASAYERSYRQNSDNQNFSDILESGLTAFWRSRLRVYADGSTPLGALLQRVVTAERQSQYLITLPDRSRIANYDLVKMPGFYLRRVKAELGLASTDPPDPNSPEAEAVLTHLVQAIPQVDNRNFRRSIGKIRTMVAAIQRRGGTVTFIRMPTSGLTLEISERMYPRSMFWDRFSAEIETSSLHFLDSSVLRRFSCPDGSHLDAKDRGKFTLELVRVLGLSGSTTSPAD